MNLWLQQLLSHFILPVHETEPNILKVSICDFISGVKSKSNISIIIIFCAKECGKYRKLYLLRVEVQLCNMTSQQLPYSSRWNFLHSWLGIKFWHQWLYITFNIASETNVLVNENFHFLTISFENSPWKVYMKRFLPIAQVDFSSYTSYNCIARMVCRLCDAWVGSGIFPGTAFYMVLRHFLWTQKS
jgi:hypothetical protein